MSLLNGYPRKVYGAWAGNPRGTPYDKLRCAYSVIEARGVGHQCQRRASQGIWCHQHHPDAIRGRRDKAEARYNEEVEATFRPHNMLKAYRRALRTIAKGNDAPQRTAQYILDKWED
jgi:hypothetical protein